MKTLRPLRLERSPGDEVDRAVKTSEASAGQAGDQPRMVYRQYGGRYYGFKMKALVGYTVTGNYGYCVVGVYADSDEGMESAVSRSIGSFTLGPGMS